MTTAQKRRLRPRDAASLIVLDRVAGGSWRVLMGRRRADLAFMPGKYVFPGGRVDRTDDTARAEDELEETVARRLAAGLKPHQSLRRARGLALAAVRETFEETGHFLGAPFADKPSRHSNWKPFHEAGYVPRLSALRYLARAVTPPGRPRRFDTRFFFTTADSIAGALQEGGPSGELEDVVWVGLEETEAFDLPRITHVILGELAERLDAQGAEPFDVPVPTYKFLHGQFHRTLV